MTQVYNCVGISERKHPKNGSSYGVTSRLVTANGADEAVTKCIAEHGFVPDDVFLLARNEEEG